MGADEAVWRESVTGAAQRWARLDRDAGVLCSGRLLVQALDYSDLSEVETEYVRASVAKCLREGDELSVELAVPQMVRILIELLSDRDDRICFRAEHALEQMVGSKRDLATLALEGLLARLSGPAGPERSRAARVLEEVVRVCPEQVGSQTVDVLAQLLHDPDLEVCSKVAYALERVAADRSDLAEVLITNMEGLLAGPNDTVRTRAARILKAVMTANPEVMTLQRVETAIGLFRNSAVGVCSRAQYVLEHVMASRPELVVEVAARLDGLMSDPDVSVRARATRLLEKVIQADSKVVTEERVRTLVELSRERNEGVSRSAEYVLKRIVEISPGLRQLAEDGQGAGLLTSAVP